ncbi:MAG: ThuA domain-containing protein [Kiritimatiellae bacterium]|nr:ThuA domain-containing protein [Kiritimatiellia bacterium]
MGFLRRTVLSAATFALAAAAVAAEPGAAVKKVLVFSRIEGFNHKASVAACKEMMAAEAEKGAFAVDFSDDYAALEISNLVKYAALVLNNTTHLKTKDHPSVAPSICSYVRWGGGLCVIHAGADNFYDAPDCAHLVGGRFDGHPWGGGGTWAFKVEDRDSPITAPFKGFADGKFKRSDEIYQQASPFYDRAKLHVLISLDLSDPATAGAKGMKRADRDFAVSWIRRYGNGRVFYTSFAHDRRAWDAEDTRAHIFAGLAYAMGTLIADDAPSAAGATSCAPPASVAQERDPPALGELAAAVLDRSIVGSDWRKRQEQEFQLGAALVRAAEEKGAQAVATTARKIFARRDLTEMLRANAARVLLAADVSVLAEVLNDPSEKVRQAAFGRGLAIPPEAFVKVLEGRPPKITCAILARLAQDDAKQFAKTVAARVGDSNEDVAVAACAALGRLGSAVDVDVLNEARKRGGAVGKAAEAALEELPGAGERIFALAASDSAMLSIAGKRAELKFLPKWKAFIASPDAATRKAAWKAFGAMASPAAEVEIKTWFRAIKDEEAGAAGNVFWSHVVKPLDAKEREKAILGAWCTGSPAARRKAQELLSRDRGLDALDTWERLAGDAKFGADAKKVYCEIAREALAGGTAAKVPAKSQWKCAASRSNGGDKPERACDGKPETRWSTGFRSKGAWFALDLGSRVFIDTVTLDTTKSPHDTPAWCDVFVSLDGETWNGPVATCDDKTVKTSLFRLGCAARHVKFIQKEERPSNYWSIHEIEVKADVDKERLERIQKKAAAFGLKEVK